MSGPAAWVAAVLVLASLRAADAASADAASSGAGAVRAEEAHAQLQEILEQPLYQRWKLRQQRSQDQDTASGWRQQLANAFKSLTQDLRALIDSLARKLAQWSPAGGGGATLWSVLKILGWLALAALLTFLGVTLYRLLLDPQRRQASGRLLSREQVRAALERGSALALDGGQWLEEARRLARAGEFRSVYRALYLGLLSGLHDNGAIVFRRQRTNWTYVAQFRGSDQQRAVFRALTTLFDEVWYGQSAQEPADLEGMRAQVAALIREGGARP